MFARKAVDTCKGFGIQGQYPFQAFEATADGMPIWIRLPFLPDKCGSAETIEYTRSFFDSFPAVDEDTERLNKQGCKGM